MKNIARKTTTASSVISRSHAENALKTYNYCVSELTEVEGSLADDIQHLNKLYSKVIEQLQSEKDRAFEVIHAYAIKNPSLFEKRKSIEWSDGSFGFRKGMPRLKISKGFTLNDVMMLMKLENASYVRTVEELNKDMIISDRQRLGGKADALGIEIVQDESFFVQARKNITQSQYVVS